MERREDNPVARKYRKHSTNMGGEVQPNPSKRHNFVGKAAGESGANAAGLDTSDVSAASLRAANRAHTPK